MTDPKTTIMDAIDGVTGATVTQSWPEVEDTLPIIVFKVQSNVPQYNLDNEIVKQDIVIKMDFFSNTSGENAALLQLIEPEMRKLGYRLTFNQDLVEQDGTSHQTI